MYILRGIFIGDKHVAARYYALMIFYSLGFKRYFHPQKHFFVAVEKHVVKTGHMPFFKSVCRAIEIMLHGAGAQYYVGALYSSAYPSGNSRVYDPSDRGKNRKNRRRSRRRTYFTRSEERRVGKECL